MYTAKLRIAPLFTTHAPLVEADNLRLLGVVAMQEGEARGHNLWADNQTLQLVQALGNKARRGIATHFGHTGMSEDATGKRIGTASNFVVMGDKLLQDIQFSEAAKLSPIFPNDPIDYIMHIAKNSPNELGMSAVLKTYAVWTLANGIEIEAEDENGVAIMRPENASTEYPVMRPVALYYSDVVSEGALTPNGFFSGTSGEFLDSAFAMLDEWRTRYNIPMNAVKGKLEKLYSDYKESRTMRKKAVTRTLNSEELITEEILADDTPPSDDDEMNQATVDPLDQVEQIADQTAQAVQNSTSPKIAINAPDNRIAELEERLERLTVILAKTANNVQALQKQLARIEGEPFVDKAIITPAQLQRGLQTPSLSAILPQDVVNQKPQSLHEKRDKGMAGLKMNPTQESILRNRSRKEQHNL